MRRCILFLAVWLALPGWAAAQPSTLARLEVFPASRVLHAPHATQQLAVIAHFTNGVKQDVTRLTTFISSDAEVATINGQGQVRFWEPGEVAILCRYHKVQSITLTYVDPKPGFVWPDPPQHNGIDRLVFGKLKVLNLPPSDLCSDPVFVRRAYLDLCGLRPTPHEVKRFLADERVDRRKWLIDELLERPEYADLWAHHWAKSLKLSFGHRVPMLGMAYVHWIRGYVRQNAPLDQLARDIIVGKGAITERGPVSFYTGGHDPPASWAERCSEAFLGVHLYCLQCHVMPESRFTTEDWRSFTAFFPQAVRHNSNMGNWQIDMTLFDPKRELLHPETKKPVMPRFPDGTTPKLKPGQDRRAVVADWLTNPKNPYFARTMVNRIWANLLGKGIGDPPDQLHELPITANDALLDMLAQELIAERFDAKAIIRLIMNSRTYQLSPETNKLNKGDEKYFSHAYRTFPGAEVSCDVIAQFLEVPSEFDEVPAGARAVHILHCQPQMIGISGPARRCCERDRESSIAVAVQILNGPWLQERLKLPHARHHRLLAENRTDREILDELFLAAFSRLPTDSDRKVFGDHLATTKDRRQAFEDAAWALINTKEFMKRP